jgi:hypothetical protein
MKMQSMHRGLFACLFAVAAITVAATVATPAGAVTKTFCVEGTTTGVAWSWGIVINESLVCSAIVGEGWATGLGPLSIVSGWVNSLVTNCPECTYTTLSQDGRVCFTITCADDFQFWVGDAAGDPLSGCQITNNPSGCQFNPLVYEYIEAIPVLGTPALVVLVVLLLLAATWVIRRRHAPAV